MPLAISLGFIIWIVFFLLLVIDLIVWIVLLIKKSRWHYLPLAILILLIAAIIGWAYFMSSFRM